MGLTIREGASGRRSASIVGKRRSSLSRRHVIEFWVIMTPILLYYSLWFLFPVVANVVISFTEWNGFSGAPRWVGLANYRIYGTQMYPLVIFNTLLFAVVILTVQTSVALLIALLLNQKIQARGLFRSLWYIPTLTSAAVMAQVAIAFFSPFDGVLNNILKALGKEIVIWTTSALWMRVFIILFSIWRGVGGPVVLFLAALQGIHREIYEAAMVDGANGRNLLRYITIPLLRPMIIFVLVTGMIGGFQIFESILLMSKGGPANQTNVMMLQIYNDAFINTRMGVAAAGAVVMAIILLWFSTTNMRILSRGQVE